jgi:hypothetical protein
MNSKLKVLGFGIIAATLVAAAAAVVGACQFEQMNRMQAGRMLATAEAALVQMQNERIRRLETISSAIAANPGLLDAIAVVLNRDAGAGKADTAAIRDQLEARRRDAGLAAAAALDANGKTVVATGDTFLSSYDYSVLALAKQAKTTSLPASATISDGAGLHLVTITPLTRSGLDALLLTAEAFDETSLRTITGISKVELALVVFSGDGPHIQSTTLDAPRSQALTDAANAHKAAWLGHVGARDPNQEPLELGAQTWTVEIFAVQRSDRNTALIALVPPAFASDLANTLWLPLAAAAGVAIVVLAGLLFIHWRRTLGPIVAMTQLAERAQRGDYALNFKAPGSGIAARLANALNRILGQLDRYRVPPGTPRRRSTDSNR